VRGVGCGVWGAGCGVRGAGCGVRGAGRGVRGVGLRHWVGGLTSRDGGTESGAVNGQCKTRGACRLKEGREQAFGIDRCRQAKVFHGEAWQVETRTHRVCCYPSSGE
jgi:hypothetical protein